MSDSDDESGPGAGLVSTTGVLVVVGLVAMLGSLDSALNIAFPDLSDELDLTVGDIQWVVISYVATVAGLLVVAGRLADVMGHRPMLMLGLAISSLGFAANGSAPGLGWLLMARVVQGVGVAAMMAAAPALVTLTVAPHHRGRGLGLFQMSAALGLAAGPVLGGMLVALWGWRAVFWFRLPCSLLLLVVVAGALTPPSSVDVSTDRVGGGRDPAPGWVSFTRPGFAVANLLNLAANASMFAIWLLVPYYVVDVLDTGAVIGGLVLTVVPLIQAASSPIAGSLSDRFGPGWISSIGLAVEALGLAALARFGVTTTTLHLSLALAAVGLGLGLFGPPNMSYVMGSIGRSHQGVAAGIAQMMRALGVVTGVYGASAFFEHHRGQADLADPVASFVHGFRATLGLSALVCSLAVALSVARVVGLQLRDVAGTDM